MESNKILQASMLDILFDGRNKAYGAYQLRKEYNTRLTVALLMTAALSFMFSLGSRLASASVNRELDNPEIASEVILQQINQPKEKSIPAPTRSTMQKAPTVATVQYTAPTIVRDEPVPAPPTIETIEGSQIGIATQRGIQTETLTAPTIESGTGEAILPITTEKESEHIFIKVENPAEFPGGLEGWRRYLERTFRYPEQAQEAGIEGIINVQMTVDKEGNITEVKALNDLGGGTAEEAERVIRKGPKWKPAEQNGEKVTYRFVQRVTFRLPE